MLLRAIARKTVEHTYGSIFLLDDSSSASTFPEPWSKRGRLSGGSPTSPRGLLLPKGQDCFARLGGDNRSATGRRDDRSIGDCRLRDICSREGRKGPSRRRGSGALVTRDSMRAVALDETSSDPSGEYGLLSITSSKLPPAAYPY